MSTFSSLAAEVEPRTIAPGPRLNEQSVNVSHISTIRMIEEFAMQSQSLSHQKAAEAQAVSLKPLARNLKR
jgi:hypothetical protein